MQATLNQVHPSVQVASPMDWDKFYDYAGQLAAIHKTQAVIEFAMDGTILHANENYLNMFGYTLEELKGKHHSVVVDEQRRNSQAYRDLWGKLNRGETDAGEYLSVGKGGRQIWIRASFTPVLDVAGKPIKVIQFSNDITKVKMTRLDSQGQIAAVRKSMCVAEFLMDCTIRNVNKNFLTVLGYNEEELVGRNANLFTPPGQENARRCEEFWKKLSGGAHQVGQFHWVGKGDREIVLEASFNPILDINEKPCKVVMFATEVTRQVNAINTMLAEAALLSRSAQEGKLAVRADLNRHEGAYREIIGGFNQTLDTVVAPLRAAADSAEAMASSSEELSAVSQQMALNAEETAMQANVASAAADQVSKSVGSVAASAQEMQASIGEIARNASESARVAQGAVAVASAASQTINKLGDSSREIGKVIRVITSIAQQTNLLALNATIEAARAGEAGKGFAVVANEVKELAKQTARATEEISAKIEAIQGDTTSAVKAIEEIGGIINSVNDLSNSIASAVEEQTVTTNEIGRSVTEAAKGVDEIARNIGSVATAAKDTTQGASQTQRAANELSRMAGDLHGMVVKFSF